MQGREEHTIKLENKIERLLADQPTIISNYKYHLSENTPSTKYMYVTYILHFAKFFEGQDLTKLTNTDIRRYLESIKYRTLNDGTKVENSASIRGSRLYAVTHFYNYLIDDGLVDRNPCDNIKPPKISVEKDIIAMNKTEVKSVMNNITNGCGTHKENAFRKDWYERDLAIFTLGCSTGLRVTAISEININDIDFENHILHVTEKGNKVRNIVIGGNTEKVLKDWMVKREGLLNDKDASCDALFISNRRNRISVRNIEVIINNYTKDLGKHITPHKMRSTCATALYDNTGDLYRVQKQLGHSRIETSKKYARMSHEKEVESANLLDNMWN